MDMHRNAYRDLDAADALPRARLPGEAAGSHPEHMPPPRRRKRGILLAGVSAIALLGGVGFLASPWDEFHPVPELQNAARRVATMVGISLPAGPRRATATSAVGAPAAPAIVAPSATLADVPRGEVLPSPIRNRFVPAPRDAQIREVVAIGPGAPAERPAASPAIPGEPPAMTSSPPLIASSIAWPREATRPSTVDGPSSLPFVPDIVVAAQQAAPPAVTQTTETAAPARPLSPARPSAPSLPAPVGGWVPGESGSPPAGRAEPGVPTAPASAHAAIVAPSPPASPGRVAGVLEARPAPPEGLAAGSLAPPLPAEEPAAPPPAARSPAVTVAAAAPPASFVRCDPVTAAVELRAAPMTGPEQIQVLGLVTQLAAMLRDTRQQGSQVHGDVVHRLAETEARLDDFARRISLAEARAALAGAQAAGMPAATSPSTAAEPRPAAPAATPRGVQLVRAAAALPARPDIPTGGGQEAGKRYRVQAASPGLAMLAEVDRGGGDGAQVQVVVGDTLPGWGRVRSIGQRGTAWVVTTERGAIQ